MLKGALQIRVSPNGRIIGLDITALLQLASLQGYDLRSFTELVPYIESGMLLGIRELQHGNDA